MPASAEHQESVLSLRRDSMRYLPNLRLGGRNEQAVRIVAHGVNGSTDHSPTIGEELLLCVS